MSRCRSASPTVGLLLYLLGEFAFPSEGPGDDPFPKEVVSVKLRGPRVGDSVPDSVEVVTDEARDSIVNFVEFADRVLHPGVQF